MKLHSAAVKVTLENSKGKEFEVDGVYWGDGSLRVANPRPQKYPDRFLYTEPEMFFEDDPKRMYWLADEDSEIGEISPFRIKYVLLDAKQLAKKPGKKRK
jgi:hypothetical protein